MLGVSSSYFLEKTDIFLLAAWLGRSDILCEDLDRETLFELLKHGKSGPSVGMHVRIIWTGSVEVDLKKIDRKQGLQGMFEPACGRRLNDSPQYSTR